MGFFTQASAAHKRVWADLIIDLVVAIFYFPQALVHAMATTPPSAAALAGSVLSSVILAVVLAIPLHAYIALQHQDEVLDEREQMFITRANRIGFNGLLIFNGMLIGLIAGSAFAPNLLGGIVLTPLLIAHFILIAIVLSRLFRAVSILLSYRRAY